MRDYGMVSPQFWIGKTGKALRGDVDAQLLALYLMTSPHATMIGVFHCPIVYMAHETGLTFEGASKGLRSLIEAGFCTYDDDTDEVFVVRMAAFQISEQLAPADKRCKGVVREYENVQSARIKSEFFAIYSVAFNLPKRKESASPFEAPSKPLRSQEQEQEQEQDHSLRADAHGEASGAPPTVERDSNEKTRSQPGVRPPADPPPAPPSTTPAGEVCKALRSVGIASVSPSNPELLALIERGVTLDTFRDAATKTVAKRKGFQYLLAIVRGQLAQAADIAAGPPAGVVRWDDSRVTIEAAGERLGLGRWCGSPVQELFSVYTDRVRAAIEAQHEAVGV